MNDGKWMTELTPATPLTEAARLVLSARFGQVPDLLPAALHKAHEDVENVHQLRVATRRARAALDIFAVCLPAKVYRVARKELRRIRRAAGDARDWDVFLASETRARPPATVRERPGRDLLMGYALAQRRAAQAELLDLGDDAPQRCKQAQNDILQAAEASRRAGTFGDLAHHLITKQLNELEHTMAGNLDDYAHLHQVRIAGKRLRYAMEIFVACFPPSFRDQLYPAVEAMQEVLGLANDSHVTLGRLQDVFQLLVHVPASAARRVKPGLESARAFHENRLVKQRAKFEQWRKRWQREALAAHLGLDHAPAPAQQPLQAQQGCET